MSQNHNQKALKGRHHQHRAKPYAHVLSVLTLLLFSLPAFSQTDPLWPSFRGTPSLTGIATVQLPKAPKMTWVYKMADGTKSSPVIGKEGIFIGCNDGFLYALGFDGKLLWKFNAGNSIEAPPLYVDNTLFFGNLEGIIYAVDAKSGTMKWKYATEGQISGSSNVVFTKEKKILTGSYDYSLYALNAISGKVSWKYTSENYINGSPATNGKIAVFGGCDGQLHLVNVNTGTAEKINLITYIASSTALDGNMAYFGNYDGEFFGVDISKKTVVWKKEGAGAYTASPAVSVKYVIMPSQDRTVYCFDKATGKSIWTHKTLGSITASPVVAGQTVVISSGDGRVYFLDLATGNETWNYEFGSPSSCTPAISGSIMVVAADDGSVYGFRLK